MVRQLLSILGKKKLKSARFGSESKITKFKPNSMSHYRTCPNFFYHLYNPIMELHNLYTLPNIIRMMKSRMIRWAGHVAHMKEDYIQDFGRKAKRKEATKKN
jgi:DUF1365 family protein